MNRVLVIFPIKHQKQLVLGQCNWLRKNSIMADALFLSNCNLRFFSLNEKEKRPFAFLVFSYLFMNLQNIRGFWRFGIANLFKKKAIRSLINNYDIIELAGVYSKDNLELAKLIIQHEKKLFVSLWGNDFYAISDYSNDWHKDLFCMANVLNACGPKCREDFVKAYPQFSNKVLAFPYGLTQLEDLKDMLDNKISKDLSFLDSRALDKIVLTIGYSGRPWQQHFYVLDALETIPQKYKEKLFLLLPMTYDNDFNYDVYIKKRLDRIGIPFQILSRRLSLFQNLSMRTISDIMVVVQLTDVFSASVQEHLMAGSVLIAGDWLPYKSFLEKGVYMRITNLEDLKKNMETVICNLEKEKELCKGNEERIYSLSSWSSKSNDYINMYISN